MCVFVSLSYKVGRNEDIFFFSTVSQTLSSAVPSSSIVLVIPPVQLRPYSLSPIYNQSDHLEPRIPFLRPIRGETHVSTRDHEPKDDELQEEPSPATTFLILLALVDVRVAAAVAGASTGAGLGLVQVLGRDVDDVVVVGELAGFGAEAKVGDRWDFNVGNLETLRPFVILLVLELDLECSVLEVGEAGFGGGILVVAETASLIHIHVSDTFRGVLRGENIFRRTEQPAASLAFPSFSLSYGVWPSPSMAMT